MKHTERKDVLRLAVIVAAVVVICVIFHAAGKGLSRTPVIKLAGKKTVQITMGADYDDDGATATLGDKNITGRIIKTDNLNTDKVGTYQITYTVKRFKQSYSVTRTVKVSDKEKPVLTLKGSASQTVTLGEKYEDPGYTATDDSDGDVTAKVKVSGYVDPYLAGDYRLKYQVSDRSGNTATAVRRIKVKGPAKKDGKSIIYLTFDDGPSTKVTPKILNTLKKYNVKATFFVINYDKETLPILKQEVSDGHTVAVHSYTHDYAKIYQSVSAFMEDNHKLRDKLTKDTGIKPTLMRFPGGSSNTISRRYHKGIMKKLVEEVTEDGYNYLDWNVDSTDASGNNVPVSKIVSSVTGELEKGRSNVVLCHDTNAKETTAKALPKIIQYGLKHGYTFAACSDDMYMAHQNILN